MGLTAARQRWKSLWPVVALAFIALLAATAQVQANSYAIPGGFGHIRLSFALRSAAQAEYALAVLFFAVLPYLVWRLRSSHALTV